MNDRLHRHGGLICFVLLGFLFAGFLPRAVARDGEVVIFSGETVVDFTGKVHALRDSTKPTPAGGKSVRLEFWRRPHSMIIGPVKGGDTFSPTEIDWETHDLEFDYLTEGVPKILSLEIFIPVQGAFQKAVVLNQAPPLMNLSTDGQWHSARVDVDGWQKPFQAALAARKIPEGEKVGLSDSLCLRSVFCCCFGSVS
jgi:hypothetical protein